MTMLDGLARQLDPDFDILTAFGPSVRRIFIDQRLPWVWGPEFIGELESLMLALRDVPAMGESLLRGLQRGELPFSFTMGANKQTLDRLDRVSTRMSLSLLVAAFIVGLALLLPVSEGNQIALALVIIGFIASVGLGVWVIYSMLRPGK
jgi:ubiquinone biosynthesis protein